MRYYVDDGKGPRGPLTIAQVRSMWFAGSLTGQMHFQREGEQEWFLLEYLQGEIEKRPDAIEDVQVIEATAKHWKAIQLWGAAIMIVGLVVFIIGLGGQMPVLFWLGNFVLVTGILVAVYGAFKGWWHHG